MAKISSAAWIAHDLGLAAAIGGTMFGREALQPALREIDSEKLRTKIADTAWRRFSWINLAAHGVIAATWFTGRAMLDGREVSCMSRRLTIAKDALVITSLATGIASALLGRKLGRLGRNQAADETSIERLRKVVGTLGTVNLIANAGVVGVTTALSMEASQSLPFKYVSRKLP